MPGDEDRCLAAGMDAYLSKPVAAERMLRLVEEQAAAHRSATRAMGPEDPPGEFPGDQPCCHKGTPEMEIAGETSPLLDLKAALGRLGGDQELLESLISMFLSDAPELLERAGVLPGEQQHGGRKTGGTQSERPGIELRCFPGDRCRQDGGKRLHRRRSRPGWSPALDASRPNQSGFRRAADRSPRCPRINPNIAILARQQIEPSSLTKAILVCLSKIIVGWQSRLRWPLALLLEGSDDLFYLDFRVFFHIGRSNLDPFGLHCIAYAQPATH